MASYLERSTLNDEDVGEWINEVLHFEEPAQELSGQSDIHGGDVCAITSLYLVHLSGCAGPLDPGRACDRRLQGDDERGID